jgi:hypothetical protein
MTKSSKLDIQLTPTVKQYEITDIDPFYDEGGVLSVRLNTGARMAVKRLARILAAADNAHMHPSQSVAFFGLHSLHVPPPLPDPPLLLLQCPWRR